VCAISSSILSWRAEEEQDDEWTGDASIYTPASPSGTPQTGKSLVHWHAPAQLPAHEPASSRSIANQRREECRNEGQETTGITQLSEQLFVAESDGGVPAERCSSDIDRGR